MPKIEMKNFFKNNEQIFRNKFHLYFLSFRCFIFIGVKKEVKMKEKKQKKKIFIICHCTVPHYFYHWFMQI